MVNRYRIIYFVPNLKHESKYAMAALVQTDEGLHVLRSERSPCPCCFDFGIDKLPMAAKLLTDLEMRHMPTTIEVKKIFFTDHLELGDIRRYPSRLTDVDDWLRKKILPR